MSLSTQEAQASLAEAESARRRSAQLYSYSKASPHLIMWGIIWVIGYSGTALFTPYSNWLWAALMLTGIGGAVIINRSCKGTDSHHGPYAWRMAAIMFIAVFFVFATYSIMWPVHGRQLAAFPILITGTVYMGMGLWMGLRYVLTGAAVVALTLFGFFYIEPLPYLYWMAFVGGGSMILAGFWFRTV